MLQKQLLPFGGFPFKGEFTGFRRGLFKWQQTKRKSKKKEGLMEVIGDLLIISLELYLTSKIRFGIRF